MPGARIRVGGFLEGLRILELESPESGGKLRVVCRCGTPFLVRRRAIHNPGSRRHCGCVKVATKTGPRSPHWTGVGEIPRRYLSSLRKSALFRGVDFPADEAFLWGLFLAQDRRCALTGVGISFGKFRADPQTASLDRKDSKLGYVVGNLQWVHKDVNRLKSNFPEPELIYWCRKILTHYDCKNI